MKHLHHARTAPHPRSSRLALPSPAGRGGKTLRFSILCAAVLVPTALLAHTREVASVPALPNAELHTAFRRLQEFYLPVAINRRLWDPEPSARATAEKELRRLMRQMRGIRLAIAGMQTLAGTIVEDEPFLVASSLTDSEPPYLQWKRQRSALRWMGDAAGLTRLQKTLAKQVASLWGQKELLAQSAQVVRNTLASGEFRWVPPAFDWEAVWFTHNAFVKLLHGVRRSEGRRLAHEALTGGRDGRKAQAPATSGHIQWPVAARRVSSGFLDRSYTRKFGAPHLGVDFVVPQGTTVRGMADGTVIFARGDTANEYSFVLLAHEDGLATLYGHLSAMTVGEGDIIMAGQPLGISGGAPGTPGAGESTGAHLHFEVLRYGVRIDPLTFLRDNAEE